ncbi:MAG TPA: M28 family peptidase, partial [Planctomycetota bacterium]|nr:M28 family peptidase [Planctomycetota bacterium]
MIVVGGDHHRLVGPGGVCAREHPDDVGGAALGADQIDAQPRRDAGGPDRAEGFDGSPEEGGQVYPGADDNASGAATVLGLARSLAAARPPRTLVFV